MRVPMYCIAGDIGGEMTYIPTTADPDALIHVVNRACIRCGRDAVPGQYLDTSWGPICKNCLKDNLGLNLTEQVVRTGQAVKAGPSEVK